MERYWKEIQKKQRPKNGLFENWTFLKMSNFDFSKIVSKKHFCD